MKENKNSERAERFIKQVNETGGLVKAAHAAQVSHNFVMFAKDVGIEGKPGDYDTSNADVELLEEAVTIYDRMMYEKRTSDNRNE